MARRIVHKHERFGRLRYLSDIEPHISPAGHKMRRWRLICDCGETKDSLMSNVLKGDTKSCGCLHRENGIKSGKSKRTHGMTKEPIYYRWFHMRERCRDVENRPWHAGRGIAVCDEWQDFEAFRDWAFSNGFSPELEIDRIDNDGNYEPSNCQWITRKRNCENKSNGYDWHICGVKYSSAMSAAKALGVGETTIGRWVADDRKPDCWRALKYPKAA